jgi:hypothetical protein
MVIALLLLGGGAALVLQYAGTGGREAWLSVPYANPSGLCWDGKSVWACDWVTGTVYRHTRDDSLTLLSSYKVPGVEPTGIACDGKNIWLSHAFGQKIYKERPDGKLVVLATYPSPGPTPGGLYYDGNALWSLDYQKGRVYRHVMNRALSVATAYDSPAANPCGMFRYGKDYFIADGATGRLFAVRPDNFAIRGVFELPGPDAKKMHLTAATCDGKNLWAGFDETSKLLRLPMKKLVKVKQ